MLRHNGLPPSILVDCSHGNSEKDHRNQSKVLRDIIEQRRAGRTSITGFMLESNLVGGRQDIAGGIESLTYGQSITDACIGWDETTDLLRWTADRLRDGEGSV